MIKIGRFNIPGNVFLAPMVGVTDRPFRMLCRSFGASLATSEMINSKTDYRHNPRTLRRLDHRGEPEPRSVQILGNDPKVMAECARFSVDQGADIIDINMGCPAKKVCRRAAGSALMADVKLSAAIFKSMVESVNVPITVKMRLGVSLEELNVLELAHIAEDSGLQAIAIHGRSRACFYNGEAKFELIGEVKRQVNIPVIANGDIDSCEKAKSVLEGTQADGIMIGRYAQQKPWAFGIIQHYLNTGEILPEPTLVERKAILINHVKKLYDFYDDILGVRVARKHVRWQLNMGCEEDLNFWVEFNKLQSSQAQLQAINGYFN